MRKSWTRRGMLTAMGAFALVPLLPKAPRFALPELTGPTMGTRYRVRMGDAPYGLRLPKLKRTIERVLETTDRLMSTYRPDSELSRFNASAIQSWQGVSAPTARVLETALRVQRESGGAFNPAAAPLVDYWGFGAVRGLHRASATVPHELLSRVTEAEIELDHGRVRKSNERAALNLNAIAKGDALDRVAQVLERVGAANYLLEIGGEIRTRGAGPKGGGWRVGIEHPRGGVHCVLELEKGQAVATSGDYVDFFMEDGRRHCHILDPRTGRPVEHGLSLVSVVAKTAMEADVWATALIVMGPEQGWRYATQRSMAALFLLRERDEYLESSTPAFDRLRVDKT